MKGNINILTVALNKSGHITKEQLKEISSSKIIEVGAHSHNLHGSIIEQQQGETTDQYKDRLKKDFSYSKQLLESVTGQNINVFALSEGRYNKNIIDAAQSVGLEMFLGSERGVNNIRSCGKSIVLKRVSMTNISLSNFKKMVDNNFQ